MNHFYINEETVVKLKSIDETCQQNLFIELVKLFKSETPKRIIEIKKAVLESDFKNLNRAAHSLKSGSAYLGADMISKISSELELSASQNEMPRNIDSIIKDLEHFFQLATDYFNSKQAA